LRKEGLYDEELPFQRQRGAPSATASLAHCTMPTPPTLDPYATPLAKKLAARITAFGPMSVHDYMEACLYDPEHGYYRNKSPLGRGGDFITAPEISQTFGELIGLWAGEIWRRMGEPKPLRLIELGPGRGFLMADALRALKVLPSFLKNVSVHLVESSAPLRAAQKAALSPFPVPIAWHDAIADVPDGAAIVIANEFFDCLPVRQFAFNAAEGGWRERVVAFENGAFWLALGSAEETPGDLSLPDAEDGAILERRPSESNVIHALAARTPLAALIIDYGYACPSFGDTLQAVRKHRFAGLFDAPGESDLTAHVDFEALRQAAAEAGLTSFGPMPMGEWLLRLGLETRLHRLLANASPEEAEDIKSRAVRLVDPAQMGALFKVLVLTGSVAAPPPPFV
jgi:NADH dehydrogenase [ubiquinone] 1 alpha subcomplex assembly factor 7